MSENLSISTMNPKDINALVEKNKENGWQDLQPAERMFVFYYLENFNHRDAAVRAGFTKGQGIHLLRRPLVDAFLAEAQAELQSRSKIDADFVRIKWLEVLPKLMGEEEIPLVDSKGESFYAKKFDASGVTKTLTELGKSTKFYDDGSGGSNAAVTINVNLEALGIKEKDVTTTIEGKLSE